MAQTTYNLQAPVAFAGMLADSGASDKRSISRASEEVSAVAFGKPAVAGTDGAKQFLLPSGAADVFLGITVHHHGTEDPTDDGIANGETAELLTKGPIWVIAADTVAVGDPVYWRHTTAPGTWRNVVTDSVLVPGARWMTATGGADQLAVIEINEP
jgi:hypothetical protein